MPGWNPDMPLSRVWAYLKAYGSKGTDCPACGQKVKIYWRTINSVQAASAVRMLRMHYESPGRFIHVPSEVGRRGSEESKLVWWGLVEEENARRADGGRAGYWRLTPKGVDWAMGRISVPHYAIVLHNELKGCTSYSEHGNLMPDTSVHDALAADFSYAALMAGEG